MKKTIITLLVVMLTLICAIALYNTYYEPDDEVVIIDISTGVEFAFAHDVCLLFNRRCSFNIMPNSSIYLTNRTYTITAPITMNDGSRIIGRGNSTTLLLDISEEDFPCIILRESVAEISNIYIESKHKVLEVRP